MFDAGFIDQSIKDSLPSSYVLRPLSSDDYSKGFFENFKPLAGTGDVAEDRFRELFQWMKAKSDIFYNIVIEHEGRIVANAMLIVEQKFIWNLGKCGHIEEVSVSTAHQGKGLGKVVIQALDSVARNVGCLKNILNCSDENEAFYVKTGYEKSGAEMEHKFEAFAKWED